MNRILYENHSVRHKSQGIRKNVSKIKHVFIICAISTTFPKSPNLPKFTIFSKNAKIGQNRPKFTIFSKMTKFAYFPIFPNAEISLFPESAHFQPVPHISPFSHFLIMLHFVIYPYFPYFSYLHFPSFSPFSVSAGKIPILLFFQFSQFFYISAFSSYMNFVHIFHIPSFQYKEIPNILLFFQHLTVFPVKFSSKISQISITSPHINMIHHKLVKVFSMKGFISRRKMRIVISHLCPVMSNNHVYSIHSVHDHDCMCPWFCQYPIS